MFKLNKNAILILTIIAVIMMAMAVNVAYAQQKPKIIGGNPTTIILAPGTPVWNPFAPGNMIGNTWDYLPLAAFNPLTGQWWPILAKNWTIQVLPNGSGILTVYLRRNIYWFNGSAVLPFTAWDVYARFYIGVKAFHWYYPFMNYSYADEDIRVINNYTIQFLFQTWTPYIPYWLLTTWISTPYVVWKPIVEKLQSMNVTEAAKYATNITEFVPPYWGLFPYYLTYVSTTYIDFTLEPDYFNGVPLLASWYKVFPFAAWQYYDPTAVVWETGGNAQALSGMLAGKITYDWIGLSESQVKIINGTPGWSSFALPVFQTMGIYINPHYYPYNIPQVREALCYVINRTEVAAAFGLGVVAEPDYYPEPIVPETINTFPPDVRQFIIPCSYNWTKAAQILESLGFKKINGYWYTPNGTKLTLEVLAPSAFTDWMTMASDAVEQLDAFGIDAKLVGQNVGVFYGTIIPNGQYQAATNWLSSGAPSYSSAWNLLQNPWAYTGSAISAHVSGSNVWPFQWPNGTCTPVTAPASLRLPNSTIVWCVNSTFGYINLTNWQMFEKITVPGTPEYNLVMKIIFAWYYYFVPAIPLYDKLEPYEYMKSVMDPNWLFQPCIINKYPVLTYELEFMPWGYGNGLYSNLHLIIAWGLVAPPGVIPPVAQAIINGSLWTKYPQYAAFLGIPNPDPQLQACVASYFHVPYTPVTTTTTATTTTTTMAVSTMTTTMTSTVTSTITTTVTTTAVTTATVTKPVISTALIAGIVEIVVVVAAVTALIALRRR